MMKKTLPKQRKNLKSFINLSILILVLSITLTIALTENLIRLGMRNTLRESGREYAEYMCQYIELELVSVNDILYRYMLDDQLIMLANNGDRLGTESENVNLVHNMISRSVSENALVDDIIIIFENQPHVLTKEGFFSKDYYYEDHLFIQSLLTLGDDEVSTVKIYPYFKKTVIENDITTEKPVMLFFLAANNYTISLFLDYDTLSARINAKDSVVISTDNTIVYSNMDVDSRQLFANEAFRSGKEKVEINGDTYLLTRKKSSILDWDYNVLYPMERLNHDVSEVTSPYRILYTLILVLGIIFLRWYGKKIIDPIRRLLSEDSCDEFTQEEFIALNNMIGGIRHENQRLSEFVSYNKKLSRRIALENMALSGMNVDKTTAKNYFSEMDLSYFLLVKVAVMSPCEDIKILSQDLEDSLLRESCYFQEFGFAEKTFYLICNTNFPQEICELLNERLHSWNTMGYSVFAAAADPMNDIEDFSGAVKQIELIVHNRNISRENCVFNSDDIILYDVYEGKRDDYLKKIIHSISQGDTSTLQKFLRTIALREKAASHREMKQFLSLLLQTLQPLASSMDQDITDLLQELEENDIVDLRRFEIRVQERCLRIAEAFAQRVSAEDNEIISYIKENYNNYISLDLVAQRFNMNTNYLSGYIKQRLGMTYTEYINSLRLENAKRLLLETDKPIQEIAENVGFESNSYFIRFFKKMAGSTPGDYRKQGASYMSDQNSPPSALS